jgi:hypothetical protein
MPADGFNLSIGGSLLEAVTFFADEDRAHDF